jgi:hypothetical protein
MNTAPQEVVTCTGGHQVKDVEEHELRASTDQIAAAARKRIREMHHTVTVAVRVEDCPTQ